jgi:hypothetical protein
MPLNLDQLIEANRKSIDLLKGQVEQLEDKKDSLPTEDQFVVQAAISDLQTRIRTLEFTTIHLGAGRIVVEFDDAEAAKLRGLEDSLDGFIVRDAQVNSILASLPPLMTAAVKIDAMINAHIAQA